MFVWSKKLSIWRTFNFLIPIKLIGLLFACFRFCVNLYLFTIPLSLVFANQGYLKKWYFITEKCWFEEIKGGAFSIHLTLMANQSFQLSLTWYAWSMVVVKKFLPKLNPANCLNFNLFSITKSHFFNIQNFYVLWT